MPIICPSVCMYVCCESFQIGVIVTACVAQIGTLGSKLAIEKDWILVICGQDKTQLASESCTEGNLLDSVLWPKYELNRYSQASAVDVLS